MLFFKVVVNLSLKTGFPSLYVEYILTSFFPSHDFVDLW